MKIVVNQRQRYLSLLSPELNESSLSRLLRCRRESECLEWRVTALYSKSWQATRDRDEVNKMQVPSLGLLSWAH